MTTEQITATIERADVAFWTFWDGLPMIGYVGVVIALYVFVMVLMRKDLP